MTTGRVERFGPTWRVPEGSPVDDELTLVFCTCGVDMQFQWPRANETVRCFGCGATFARPPHFPVRPRLTWNPPPPDAPPPPIAAEAAPPRRRRLVRAGLLLLLLAAALLAAALLGWSVGKD